MHLCFDFCAVCCIAIGVAIVRPWFVLIAGIYFPTGFKSIPMDFGRRFLFQAITTSRGYTKVRPCIFHPSLHEKNSFILGICDCQLCICLRDKWSDESEVKLRSARTHTHAHTHSHTWPLRDKYHRACSSVYTYTSFVRRVCL